MRPVSLGKPILKEDALWKKWAEECFAELERATYEDEAAIANDFSVVNHTPTRTIDKTTATLSDVANVLCTLIEDLQNRGSKRNQ